MTMCSRLVSRGARVHTAVFRTLSLRTCSAACERQLRAADESLDVAVKAARRGHCRALGVAVARAERSVRAARRVARSS
jgi:hypothetical protein